MLLLMLVAIASLGLCSRAGAQPLCRVRTVRTGKALKDGHQTPRNVLYSSSVTTRLIKHPCKKNLALFLGRQLFFTAENFEGSLSPLSIPPSMQVGKPEVTSAHFADLSLLLVVNKKVYVYNIKKRIWTASTGIKHPVSHISGDNCCYGMHFICSDMSKYVFAYSHGDKISEANVYFSYNWGYTFVKYRILQGQALPVGSLGGVFNLYSLSQIGVLLINQQKAKFKYSDYPLNHSFGLPFDYNSTLDVIIAPGQKGILIFWSEKSLLVSRNSGQLVFPVQVQEKPATLYPSVFDAGITIHAVAANENELAVLTREDNVYYGSLGILTNFIVKLPHQNIWSQQAAMMFSALGILEIVTPIPDSEFPAFDFLKCLVNIQAVLMDPQLKVDVCKVEVLEGDFDNKMYTIDMNSKLELTAVMIPRPGTSPVPLAMVSNPHSLGLNVFNQEVDYTYDGNTKHRLKISLKQQQLWGRADPNFTSSIKKPTMSTITVDIANKEISCVDLQPLTALISIGCDLKKKIVVQKEISACYKGYLDPVALQDNYSYVIEKEAYDRSFRGQRATKDLLVHYPYEKLGCPLLIHYDRPWKPVVELWREGKFQEVVNAEYVMLEVNGLFTYTYSLTADSAMCNSQPQNWTTIRGKARGRPFAWDRENYMSCHQYIKDSPLRWPNVPYQIMGGPTDNKIIFDQRNGIYVFLISIVDPYYSYCHLTTIFSVYVYGAFPLPFSWPEITIFLLMSSILLSVWLAYMIPKQLHTEEGRRLRGYWVSLRNRCRRSCEYFQCRH
ncbi:cation channel sperm-associated protein subunit delta [Pipistrellus kuhlii]|uniref:Cation channel sperm-associated auxiliary subunit delta n=1 Tax=Pipistrellus kuhlii TaxID=59472 RepID=A0A7J7T9P6_PIPKU|nr:cation channel sperm-associated protein subunit delta [Pipistrellus kuhlii]KAF6297429.1 cation channel sperm associated auxiliary subunit delta [Pipistrellus kuhlii]